MTAELTTQDWYQSLIEDCDGLITEGIFTARWLLIQMYHDLGSRILQDEDKFLKDGFSTTEAVQRVADSLGKSRRTILYAVQFARQYPDPQQLPGGKNISWHKICNKVLAGKSLDEKCGHENSDTVKVCRDCHCRIG